MKKILIINVFFFIVCANISAMDTVSDELLDSVTGKQGISCYVSNNRASGEKIQVGLYFGKLLWGDEEGGNEGYVIMYGTENIGDTQVAQSGIEWDVESSLLTADTFTDAEGITKIRLGLPVLTSKPALSNYYYINLSNASGQFGTNLGVIYSKEVEITIPDMPEAMEIWAH